MGRNESKFGRGLILQVLDLGRKEFDHQTTGRTDHVIVVFVLKMVFVVCLVVAEADLAGQAGFCQQFERTINRRVADRWVAAADTVVEVLDGHVRFRPQERFHYQITLLRPAKTESPDVLEEHISLSLKFCGFLRHLWEF